MNMSRLSWDKERGREEREEAGAVVKRPKKQKGQETEMAGLQNEKNLWEVRYPSPWAGECRVESGVQQPYPVSVEIERC